MSPLLRNLFSGSIVCDTVNSSVVWCGLFTVFLVFLSLVFDRSFLLRSFNVLVFLFALELSLVTRGLPLFQHHIANFNAHFPNLS